MLHIKHVIVYALVHSTGSFTGSADYTKRGMKLTEVLLVLAACALQTYETGELTSVLLLSCALTRT